MLPRASSVCVDVRYAARASEHARASVVTSLVPASPELRSLSDPPLFFSSYPCPRTRRRLRALHSARDVVNLAELVWRELPGTSAGERAERHRTEANAHEPIDVQIERLT